MEKVYLAHRSEDQRKQTVLEHLNATAELCARFSSAFGAEEQGRLAGLAHDIGKYSDAFQRRINGSDIRVDHATAGAWECAKLGQLPAAFAAAGHHGGLPDGGGRTDNSDQGTFCGRMNRAAAGRLEPYDAWREELTLPAVPPPSGLSSLSEEMFFTRMLYSCLVDADFLDTEEFMDGGSVRGGGDPMEALDQKLQAHIAKWHPPKNPLNEQRRALLSRCIKQGELQVPGLFTLTLPTGSGKTVASLAFALRHARAQSLQRVVYVLPYTSIIEQNAQVFRDILGGDNVLEHHSGMLYDLTENADPQTVRLAKATENWDMPVVVTTAVQFFESLFAARSSKCRKLHNLARSVIIFDEAQMLPVPYLRPCVFAIAQLVRHYQASAVLCTATQPSLGALFQEFLPDTPPVELCPAGTYRESIFQRVTFRREGVLGSEELAQRLNRLPQVLCVVNRRKTAQELYGLLDKEGAFHLSTLMYPAHRKKILSEIRQRLINRLPCRVISTSLIEAGVDVDFPAVFREEAGLDSILQSAGRCNREGKGSPEESIVTIFRAETPPPQLFRRNIDAGRQALDHTERPDSPEAIACYFDELLGLTGKKGQDQQGILALMEDTWNRLPFQTVAERFHLIQENTRTVYIPQGDGEDLAARLRSGERSRSLFRKLGQYSVSVYPDHFRSLNRAGALELLEDGSGVLTDLSLYQENTGLIMEIEARTIIL